MSILQPDSRAAYFYFGLWCIGVGLGMPDNPLAAWVGLGWASIFGFVLCLVGVLSVILALFNVGNFFEEERNHK